MIDQRYKHYWENERISLPARASFFAMDALRGKEDKAGDPLFVHAHRMGLAATTDETAAVAYLHDVVEDSDVTVAEIRELFGDQVAADVAALTRQPGEIYMDYIRRVFNSSETARVVKIADIHDHLDHSDAISDSLVRRYERALIVLTAGD